MEPTGSFVLPSIESPSIEPNMRNPQRWQKRGPGEQKNIA